MESWCSRHLKREPSLESIRSGGFGGFGEGKPAIYSFHDEVLALSRAARIIFVGVLDVHVGLDLKDQVCPSWILRSGNAMAEMLCIVVGFYTAHCILFFFLVGGGLWITATLFVSSGWVSGFNQQHTFSSLGLFGSAGWSSSDGKIGRWEDACVKIMCYC